MSNVCGSILGDLCTSRVGERQLKAYWLFLKKFPKARDYIYMTGLVYVSN